MAITALLLAFCCATCVSSSMRGYPPTWEQRLLARAHPPTRRDILLNQQSQDCAEKPADLVFVLDGSSSIWNPDFKKQLKFVSNVIDSFTIGEEYMKVGVMTFSSTINPEMFLGQYNNDKGLMNDTVMSIEQPRGETHTGEALRTMRETMFNAVYIRPGVPHIGVIITDGASRDPALTAREAQRSKEAGITMLAIGVGRNLVEEGVQEELQNIASGADYVFTVKTYDALEKLKAVLANKACEATTMAPITERPMTTTTAPSTTPKPQMIEGCDGRDQLDVLFSAPDEAGIADTEMALEFIQTIVDGFQIGPQMVQAGMTPRLCTDLDGIRLQDHDDKGSLQADIGSRGLTSTQLSQQIEYMLQQGFTAEDGTREHSRKVAIMIVDNAAEDPEETRRLAEDARAEGITIIAIGVGPYANQRELSSIATSSDHVYHVASYEQLMTLPERIHKRLCSDARPPPTPPPQMIEGCVGGRAMDVLLAAPDESGIRQTELAVSFLQNVTGSFWISDTQVQVGMTPRMCRDFNGISLRTHDEKESLKSAISRRRLLSSVVSRQLEYMLGRGFTREDGSRPGAEKFALLMVDNAFADPRQTLELAAELKEAGVTVLAVGIGSFAEELDLMQVASSSDHLFTVESYDELNTVLAPVLEAFCRDIS